MAALEHGQEESGRARARAKAGSGLQWGAEGCEHRVACPVGSRRVSVESASDQHQFVACALAPKRLGGVEATAEEAI